MRPACLPGFMAATSRCLRRFLMAMLASCAASVAVAQPAQPAQAVAPAPAPPPAAAASAAPSDLCPPVAQAPTPEQMRHVQRDARDHGFLWRISKNGRNSWLYGTIHVGKLAWAAPGPRTTAALIAAQALVLELDLMDEQTLAQLASPPVAAPPAMPAAWQQRLQRQMGAACLPATALANQHPVMQAVTLTVLSARRDGLDPAFALEFVLGGFAREVRKPVLTLETPAQQLAALLPGDQRQVQEMAENTLAQLEDGRARTTLLRAARAWELGDLDDLSQYERWCNCADSPEDRAYLRRLNDERNVPMADRIDALHAGGQSLFVAVGALHMTGAKGLPRLMGQRGYRVERVAFQPL